MPQPHLPRRTRYERVALSAPFKVTDRDLEIVHYVYQHRFLTSEQIAALIGGSQQGVTRRLNRLFHAGWLDRPRGQLLIPDRMDNRCNHAMIYALGHNGAKYLSGKLDLPLSTVNWTSKNSALKNGFFFEHTLLVAEFMVMVRLACRNSKDFEFISQEEIVNRRRELPAAPAKELGFEVKVMLYENQRKPLTVSVVPDAAFGLRRLGGAKAEMFFFLEADRATMPIRRTSLQRSSFYKKMLGYYHAWKSGTWETSFDFKHARVMTITTSLERIENMVSMGREIDPWKKGLGMFLFAPMKQFNLQRPEQVFEYLWITGNGKKVRILD